MADSAGLARYLRLRSAACRLATRLCLILLGGVASAAFGQKLTVAIEVLPGAPGRLVVEASGPTSSTWSFPDSYAGVLGLAGRIEKFQALDAQGREVLVRKLAPGQFASTAPAIKFKYEIRADPPARPTDAALVSWLDSERGMLLMGDLLPVFASISGDQKRYVSVRLALPAGCRAHSVAPRSREGEIDFADAESAVIAVGKNLRSSTRAISNTQLTFVADTQWAFADDEAVGIAVDILKLHSEVAGRVACANSALILLPFPQPVAANKWSAQTRGCTVTLLMGKLPSKVGALSQLGLALTHELFHLWIPNGLALSGEYDWFYEGFTMYQAARAAVRLDLLTFQQFLNAIADAYNGSSAVEFQNLSLVEASKRRWTTGGTAVYSKAMVVAFLYDLNLRAQSKGKRSLDDVYRRLFRDYLGKTDLGRRDADGNAAVISALRGELAAPDFAGRFITAAATIDLQRELEPFGLRVERLGLRTHIFVAEHLTGRQRDLLKRLGYNEPRARQK
jgi:hypothetical protein